MTIIEWLYTRGITTLLLIGALAVLIYAATLVHREGRDRLARMDKDR